MTKWTEVAREDLQDGRRDRSLYYTIGVFVLIGAGMGYLYGGSGSTTATELSSIMVLPLVLFVPLAVLTNVYSSIVGKRIDGSLKLLLALPYTRRDVFVGTLVGRSSLVVFPIIGYGVGALVTALVRGAPVDPATALGVMVVGTLYGLTFVGLTVGISAGTRSSTVAGGLAFGVFFLVFVIWPILPGGIAFIARELGQSPPGWLEVVPRLNPQDAYRMAVARTFPNLESIAVPPAGSEFYLQGWFAYAVLAGWALLGILPGFQRFRNSDL